MNNKQKIFYYIILIIFIILMIWSFIEQDYKTIIKSFCILIGSFIVGIIYAKLGEDNE